MEIQPDFKEWLELCNVHGVEYLVVGGYALAWHGAPRFTGDLDLWVKPERENARKILAALVAFGFGGLGLQEDDFLQEDMVVQLGYPPVRIDLLTSLTGVTWDEAWKNREAGTYGQVPVYFLGRSDLIANKRALGRQRDLADLEALGVE